MVEVTDADREAAERYFNDADPSDVFHGTELAEAFARHRLAEREAVVKWLREQDGYGYDDTRATCIEAGEHGK